MSSNHSTSNRSTSNFTLIFAAVLSLTIASGGTAIAIANRPTVTEQQERILDSAIALFTMGSTTIIGLLNNRPSDDNDDDDSDDDNSDDIPKNDDQKDDDPKGDDAKRDSND